MAAAMISERVVTGADDGVFVRDLRLHRPRGWEAPVEGGPVCQGAGAPARRFGADRGGRREGGTRPRPGDAREARGTRR